MIRLNKKAGSTAKRFRDLATAYGISSQFSGAQSHNALGVGEKYHELLRQVFRILRQRHPAIEPEVMPRYAVMNRNDIMGPEVYVP